MTPERLEQLRERISRQAALAAEADRPRDDLKTTLANILQIRTDVAAQRLARMPVAGNC
jgi:hypothetical protein